MSVVSKVHVMLMPHAQTQQEVIAVHVTPGTLEMVSLVQVSFIFPNFHIFSYLISVYVEAFPSVAIDLIVMISIPG